MPCQSEEPKNIRVTAPQLPKGTTIRDLAIVVFDPYHLKLRMKCDLLALNSVLRMHKDRRNEYYQSLYRDVGLLTTGKRPGSPLQRVRLKLFRNSNRMYDYDGLVASFKPVIDGLQHCGIIKHDGWYVTGPWNVGQAVSSKGNESIYVEVQEVR
jgi:hypothetical protein